MMSAHLERSDSRYLLYLRCWKGGRRFHTVHVVISTIPLLIADIPDLTLIWAKDPQEMRASIWTASFAALESTQGRTVTENPPGMCPPHRSEQFAASRPRPQLEGNGFATLCCLSFSFTFKVRIIYLFISTLFQIQIKLSAGLDALELAHRNWGKVIIEMRNLWSVSKCEYLCERNAHISTHTYGIYSSGKT